MKYNVLIIEDSEVFAKGLRMLLRQKKEIKDIFIALNYQDAMKMLKEKTISIVILDLHFRVSEYDGFIIAEKLSVNFPNVKIMVLSDYVQTDYYHQLIKNKSVKAYLDKQSGEVELFEGVDTIIRGENYLCPSIKRLKEIDLNISLF